jgi:hypothetical protein
MQPVSSSETVKSGTLTHISIGKVFIPSIHLKTGLNYHRLR